MSRRRSLHTLGALLCAIAAIALAGCGDAHKPLLQEDNTGAGGINSAYVTMGSLRYQVQISRALNPYTVEDGGYLAALPAAERTPPPGQFLLGVFMLVLNPGSHAAAAAANFKLTDTQGQSFTPIALPSNDPYAYRAGMVPAGGQIPTLGSTAASGQTQAALILFRIPEAEYDNRPLALTFADPGNPRKVGTVTLDF